MATDRTVDPVLLSVVKARLDSISVEMGIVMIKASRSPIFSQAHDFSCFLADVRGNVLCQQDGIPIHTGSGGFAVRALLDFWGDDIAPGDVFLQNDPYDAGNNHLPDWTVIRPTFMDDELVAFAANRAHQVDIGGGAIGTYNPDATELFHEGVRLPPMKLEEGGTRRRDIQQLLRLNNRLPEIVESDLEAMIGSTRIGARRLQELMERHGTSVTTEYFGHLLDLSDRAMRAEIANIPDGIYRGADSMNNDCFEMRETTVQVTVTVDGDRLDVDFDGSDPQILGFKNSPLTNTHSAVYVAISTLVDPDIPHNEGTYRPITVRAPEGSVVNPLPPAPVGYATVFPAHEIVHAIWGALGSVVPGRWSAGWGKNAFPISGSVSGDPDGFVFYHWNASSGAGAVDGADGFDQLGPVVTLGGLTIPNLEIYEKLFPVRFRRNEFRQDGGGAGRWRGGCGVEYEVTFEEPSRLIWRGDGFFTPSGHGAAGGGAGKRAEATLDPAPYTGDLPPYAIWEIPTDTSLVIESPGGGGWGSPYERDPHHVAADVRNGLVSAAAAAQEYGVVLDEMGAVDVAATEDRRSR